MNKLQHNQEVYILKTDGEKVQQYQLDQNIVDLSESSEGFGTFETSEEKLLDIYTVMVNLMQSIFDKSNEKLPLDVLHTSINQLVKSISLEENILPILLKMIPDEYTTAHHSVNVACFAVILAQTLHLSEEDMNDIGLAGLLHDIGKIRIDQMVLLKPSYLSEDEYETVQHHSDYGYEILKQNGVIKEKILNGVRFHHERLDGSGYPQGFRNKLIPIYAKIIGVCDAFDALTTKRTFRKNYTSYEALSAMKHEMTSHFDAKYIDAFILLLR